MTLISIGKVAKMFGVSAQSIRNWTKLGNLEAIRTFGGHRRYSLKKIESILGIEEEEKYTVLYSRVSAQDQKEDLERQKTELKKYSENEKITKIKEISEIGSGLNYTKKGLITLIELIARNEVKQVVVSYKDRLMRFGYEIIEKICAVKNIKIVILNDSTEKKFEELLVQDVLTILTVFCSKIYGKRSHERRKKRNENT